MAIRSDKRIRTCSLEHGVIEPSGEANGGFPDDKAASGNRKSALTGWDGVAS